MSWLIARYHPVSLFSLRPYNATTSGGKSLIAPTAFALKMALLSVSIQHAGLAEGKARFPIIRDLQIALDLPDQIVIVKSFAKIQRMAGFKGKTDERPAWQAAQVASGAYPFQPTITYKELVQFGGPLGIAITTPGGDTPAWLSATLLGINYLGKRGSFFQIAGPPVSTEIPGPRFTAITTDATTIALNGTLQPLDDCGSGMTFAHADIYDPKRISLDKERIIRHIVLPFQLVQSSRGYSRYERIGEGQGAL